MVSRRFTLLHGAVALFASGTTLVACSSASTSAWEAPSDEGGTSTVDSGGSSGGSSGSSSGSGAGASSGGSSGGGSSTGSSGGSSSSSGGGSSSSSGGGSSSGSSGAPITCPAPGTYNKNGGACGSERWDIKTGTDSEAASVSLVPKPTTIATLVALSAAGGGNSRESPTETTLWELQDVTLSMIKLESDSDYHMVLSDGSRTMIAEIPYPTCATGSSWACLISRARSEVDGKFSSISSSPQYPALTVTVRGVGFFDFLHGQTGVAPNGIELHAVLQICFGKGCAPS